VAQPLLLIHAPNALLDFTRTAQQIQRTESQFEEMALKQGPRAEMMATQMTVMDALQLELSSQNGSVQVAQLLLLIVEHFAHLVYIKTVQLIQKTESPCVETVKKQVQKDVMMEILTVVTDVLRHELLKQAGFVQADQLLHLIVVHNALLGITKIILLTLKTESHCVETVKKSEPKNVMMETQIAEMDALVIDQQSRQVGYVLEEVRLIQTHEHSQHLAGTKMTPLILKHE
jgi:hypothetical protein